MLKMKMTEEYNYHEVSVVIYDCTLKILTVSVRSYETEEKLDVKMNEFTFEKTEFPASIEAIEKLISETYSK